MKCSSSTSQPSKCHKGVLWHIDFAKKRIASSGAFERFEEPFTACAPWTWNAHRQLLDPPSVTKVCHICQSQSVKKTIPSPKKTWAHGNYMVTTLLPQSKTSWTTMKILWGCDSKYFEPQHSERFQVWMKGPEHWAFSRLKRWMLEWMRLKFIYGNDLYHWKWDPKTCINVLASWTLVDSGDYIKQRVKKTKLRN